MLNNCLQKEYRGENKNNLMLLLSFLPLLPQGQTCPPENGERESRKTLDSPVSSTGQTKSSPE